MFKSTTFWKNIKEENILIFQTDSFIMNPLININDFLDYPFIGGIYRYITTETFKRKYPNKIVGYPYNYYLNGIQLQNSPNLDFSINGGFSFRKKSIMIECLEKITHKKIIDHRIINKMDVSYYQIYNNIDEDSYFQNAIDLLGYKLPDKQTCINFCENLSYPVFNSKSFAIHNVKENVIKNNSDLMDKLKNSFSHLLIKD